MESPNPLAVVLDQLESEMDDLKAQVDSLRKELNLHTTTLLVADSTRKILKDHSRKGSRNASRDSDSAKKLLAQSDQQLAHKQQCLYRTCASVTTLKIRDPDPNAVDGGNILGLRFEVMAKSRFIRPYYVMLNRPYSKSDHLRVHRHTVPPCIPLSGLAARYLPAPKPADQDGETLTQDLPRFSRALRREIVRYHNRVAVIGDLRTAAGLESRKGKGKDSGLGIVDIIAADAAAKQIKVEWSDGKAGRLVMDDNGGIVKMVAQGGNGRDREAVRELLGGSLRVEDIVRRLDNA